MIIKKGFFITLEGPEGSGKSTQTRILARILRKKGFRVAVLRDPGSTALGRSLRRVLLHSKAALSPMAEAMLFIGGRVALVEEKIIPALKQGKVVVCDRFHDATVVYQGFAGGLDVDWLNKAGRAAIRNRTPDLTLLLDLPVKAGFARINRKHDRMEQKETAFHERVRKGYLALARKQPGRIKVISALQPAEKITQKIQRIVLNRVS